MCCPREHMPSKPCATCGRVITWRKKWLRCWEQIQHCSQRCRRHRTTDQDRKLEGAIIDLLDRRAVTATICPSEAAKTIGDEDWRSLMEPTRAAARRRAVLRRPGQAAQEAQGAGQEPHERDEAVLGEDGARHGQGDGPRRRRPAGGGERGSGGAAGGVGDRGWGCASAVPPLSRGFVTRG